MERRSRTKNDKGKSIQTAKDKGKDKQVQKSKPSSRRPNPQLVINEQRAVERNTRERESETDSSDSEEEQVQEARTKKVYDKPTFCTVASGLQKSMIHQTRWVDIELLTKMKILEDVRMLLSNMGLARILEMDHVCYPHQVMELIASFELHLSRNSTTPNRHGTVSFKVNQHINKFNISELCAIYGFPQKGGQKIVPREYQDDTFWRMIGRGGYSAGKTKATRICNPAVRYVHKVLANTLFARYETDRVNEEELALLSNGIQPIFRDEFEKQGIEGHEDINLGILLAQKIVSLKHWARRDDRKKSSLHIGGFLTPLLEATRATLSHPSTSPALRLDFACLKRMNFFEGKDGRHLTYVFSGSNFSNRTIILPNEEVTQLNSLENLRLAHGESHYELNVEPVETLLSMRNEDEDAPRRASCSELPLGSPRYYHSRYQGRTRSKPIDHAFEGIEKAHRWSKWNTRSIVNIKRSCKKKIKAMEDQFRSMIETYVFRKKTPPRRDDGEFDYDMAMEEARRHSISHPPASSSHQTLDPPRTSAQQQGHQRKRRHRHVPSPSPPASDNPSFHFTTSEQEDSN